MVTVRCSAIGSISLQLKWLKIGHFESDPTFLTEVLPVGLKLFKYQVLRKLVKSSLRSIDKYIFVLNVINYIKLSNIISLV